MVDVSTRLGRDPEAYPRNAQADLATHRTATAARLFGPCSMRQGCTEKVVQVIHATTKGESRPLFEIPGTTGGGNEVFHPTQAWRTEAFLGHYRTINRTRGTWNREISHP